MNEHECGSSSVETSRRKFLQSIGALTFAGATAGLLPALTRGQAPKSKQPPNVIIILSDDLGWGDLGCYGQTKIKTPVLDRMAAEGMRFTDAYAGSAVCAPSRSCLLTGQHTGHTPIRANPESAPAWDRKSFGDVALPEGTLTIAASGKAAGYATACIGKWGMGRPPTSGNPLKQGFDYHFGYLDHLAAHNYYPEFLWRNNEKVPLAKGQYSHDVIWDDAMRWVRDQGQKPFFLYLTPTIPHSKLNPPSVEPYADTDWKQPDKSYAAMVTRMDKDIGRLLDLLREMKIDQNTLVLFTSDNGTHSAGRSPKFLQSSGPLHGEKRDLYEGGVRVPLIVRWPDRLKPGTTSDLVTANWDFFATFNDLLGAAPPANTDGVSILPTLEGRPQDQKQHEYLYWEFYEQGGKQAVRLGKYKGVRLNVSRNADAPIELYDLSQDLGETRNIAADHADIVARINQIMKTARVPARLFPLLPAEQPTGKPATTESAPAGD